MVRKLEATPAQEADSAVELQIAITLAVQEGFGMEESIAAVMAEPIIAALRRRYACEDLYVPAPSKRERYAAIRDDFNGRNRDDVIRKHGISKSTFYEAIRSRD